MNVNQAAFSRSDDYNNIIRPDGFWSKYYTISFKLGLNLFADHFILLGCFVLFVGLDIEEIIKFERSY